MPTVTVEYRGLTVETDALVGTSALPSVGNAFLGLVKVQASPTAELYRVL